MTPTSPARPQWTLHVAPRSPRVSTSCSRALHTSLPRSLRSCRKTSSGRGASAVPGSAPSPGDCQYIIDHLLDRVSSSLSHSRGGFTGPGSVTMAGAGPSGVAAGAAGFTTIYPVTECMEVGEGELALVGIQKSLNIFLKKSYVSEQMEIQHPQ